MSGLGLCRLIVKLNPHTSVIVVSGNSDDESITGAIKAGAVEYIQKPFNVAHVIATIDRVLARRHPNAVVNRN
jgi:two-component system, NtrC family, C4-dicarboxylate transport response regulator DctD